RTSRSGARTQKIFSSLLGDLAVNSHADREALGRLAAAILRRSLATHQDLVRALNRCDPPQGGAKQLEDLLATQGGDL
ncbi:hypothetical protein ABZS98_38020, partial [Streptomyces avermitilis]|uniref:hypothetical protein n=1 Tax=Streptomyces avermitilis TaxID=33903 RepID=UPI0033A22340